MNNRILFFFVFIFLAITSCEKDKQINANAYCASCEPCAIIPPNISSQPRQIKETSFQRLAPCFNPLNANEFIYLTQDSFFNNSLIKCDLTSKKETVILTGQRIIRQPKWGKNGWILFAGLNLQIYRVKDNGDSLTQLTSVYSNTYPEWYGTDKIFFSVIGGTDKIAGNKIIGFDGKRLDSIQATVMNTVITYNSINDLNELTGIGGGGAISNLAYINLKTKKLIYLTSDVSSNERYPAGVCWHPNNKDIYYATWVIAGNNSDFVGICRLNKDSKENVLIKNACNSRSYSLISISPDGKKIIAERQDYQLLPDNNLLKNSDICIMDIDGRNEEKVFK
jgi:hypothetical protein